MNLKDHYKLGQSVLYRGDTKPGIIIKLTKSSIRVKYKGYHVHYSCIKVGFVEYLIILD
jgi:hypothetical protein